MRNTPVHVWCGLWLWLCFWVCPAWGDGINLDAHSAVSGGRGGTNLGFADNGAAVLENPGALVNFAPGRLFEASSTLLFSEDLRYRDPQNNVTDKFHFPENPAAVFNFSFIDRQKDRRWAWGIGSFVPSGYGAFTTQTPLFGGSPQTYRSFAALWKLLPAVSFAVDERLSVGAALGPAISHVELEGPFFFQTPPFAGVPSIINVDATGAAPTWTVGLQYKVSERTTLGLAYTGETRFNLKGDADLAVPGLGAGTYDFKLDFVFPRMFGAGLKHEVTQQLRVSADVYWTDWSHAFDRLDVQFTNGSSLALPATITDSIALDWNDTVSVRLGLEYDLSAHQTLRLGYIYRPSPIPEGTLTSYIPAVQEHDVTVGYSHRVEAWKFSFAYLYAFGNASVRDSQLVGDDFSASELNSDYHVVMLSASLAF